MKIAILTHPLNTNYGGILQAYALQTKLEEMGYDVTIIDRYPRQTALLIRLCVFGKRLFLKYLTKAKVKSLYPFIEPTTEQRKIVYGGMDEFVKFYMQRKTAKISSKELNNSDIYQNFDAYIVGSDQVWRPKFVENIYDNFLQFVKSNNNAKKIAYAASFGTDEWEFTKRETRICKQLVEKFEFVSVREDSGVRMCREFFDVEAVHVLDPTLLLDAQSYITNLSLKINNNNCVNVVSYILDANHDKDTIINKVCDALEITTHISLMPKCHFNRENLSKIDECKQISPQAWLQSIANSNFVVTDSFHGTVFAIIFNKPFVVIENKGRGNARMMSLLRIFGLENRLISSEKHIEEKLMRSNISWDQIQAIIKNRTTQAIEALSANLSHNL